MPFVRFAIAFLLSVAAWPQSGPILYPAQALAEPQGKTIEFGLIRPGLLADMVLVDQNPLANLKVLYGTGALRLNDRIGKVERIVGVKYTIKDGIVYDAKKLLEDVAAMVRKQEKRTLSIGPEV